MFKKPDPDPYKLLTFLHGERLVSLVDGPEPEARGLVGLGHLEDGLLPAAGLGLLLEDEASVAGLIRIYVAVVHHGHQVAGTALLPLGQARHLLFCKKNDRQKCG